MDPQHKFDPRDDEIDLFELFESLWKEKVLIVAITLVITLFGGLYAFVLAKPVYEVSVKLNPDASEAAQILSNLTFGESLKVSVDNYVRFIESPEFLEGLYNAGYFDALFVDEKPDTSQDAIRNLAAMFEVEALGNKKEPSIYPYKIILTIDEPDKGEVVLNQILDLADSQLFLDAKYKYDALKASRIERLLLQKSTLEMELFAKRNDEIRRLEEADALQMKELVEQLEIKRNTYFKKLSDRIRSLEEALLIAKSLNLIEPVALDRLVRQNDQLKANQVVEVVSSKSDDPLYMRGTRLLTAELEQLKSRPKDFIPDSGIKDLEAQIEALKVNNKIEILKARKSDESFNETLQSIRAELAKLQAESFPENLKFRFANGKAVATNAPVKPKRLLILALSVVVGGMLGIIIALVNSTRKKRALAEAV